MTFEIYLVGGRDLMIIVLVFDDAEIPVNVIAEISDRNPTKNIPPSIGLKTPDLVLMINVSFLILIILVVVLIMFLPDGNNRCLRECFGP